MGTFRLAWRNIWRHKRRTGITLAALSLALVFTVLYGSMMEGYMVNMEQGALDFDIGGAQVFAPGYQDKPSIHTRMADAADIVQRLEQQGIPAAARLLASGLVASGEASAGAQLRGIDLARDTRVLSINTQLKEGRWLDGADPRGVVLGVKLARVLGVKLGDELVVLSQATDGSIANELFTVRGVLLSVGEATDRSGVFLTDQAFRELMSFDGGAHQVVVKRPVEMPLPVLAQRVMAAAPARDVQTWRQLNPILATMMDSVRGMMAFIFFIVNIATAIVILNAMLMAVFERIKEFGILKALGAGATDVLKLIYAESLLQVVLAVGVALVVGTPALWYLSVYGVDMGALAGVSAMGLAMVSNWHAVVSVPGILTPFLIMLVVVSVAVLYPALKAALIQPVKAIHHT
ncbi:MAG: FtsX-like permease family protein [Myxococcota bacterium]